MQVGSQVERGRIVNILFATSEVVPFSKTGGLADVLGALPRAMSQLGHRPMVVTPAYRCVHHAGLPLEKTNRSFTVPIGTRTVTGTYLQSRLPGTDIPVYFVDQPGYYDRPGLYQDQGYDYPDNCERFVCFCRAAMELIRQLGLHVDVLHCNDWQTGLMPAYLRIEYDRVRGYRDLVSVMTIHNMAYQGQFWHWDMLLTGLDWQYFNWRQLEHWGSLNLLKSGLSFADAITTVSRRYADEIQSAPLGCGLESVLRSRHQDLRGIVNGVDYQVWNPHWDAHLPQPYGLETWESGKAVCKAKLQEEFGLAIAPRTPLIGFVGRLADQKGCDLLEVIMREWAPQVDVQWVILGTGQPHFEQRFAELAREYPHRIATRLSFSEPLAHRIEAGVDLFVMPSRYEPCGLSQLYSLKYGSIPVVRETGGLADTVCDASEDAIAAGKATGFLFQPYEVDALRKTLQRAIAIYHERPAVWRKLVETGMQQDWSWSASARQYMALYEQLLSRHDEHRIRPT
jgi:starch synthase